MSRVIMPGKGPEPDRYVFDDTEIRLYPVNEAPSRAELRGDVPHHGFDRFRALLKEAASPIYHQHSWTRGLGLPHLQAARQAGLKTVLTLHTPNATCLRGTMMRFGREACDGRVVPKRCGACWAEGRGAPEEVAMRLGSLGAGISQTIARLVPESRLATALSARAIGERRSSDIHRMVENADRIVAVCRWLRDALKLNGVPEEKLVLSRQGIDSDFAADAKAVDHGDRSAVPMVRLIYLGRWHPVKGIDVVVTAVRSLPPEMPVSLSIHGAGDGQEEQAYRAQIEALAAGDGRISLEAPLPRDAVASALARADALVVPSLWLETGPMVVLEAKAVGLPVIGSRLGGIAELVTEPEDGILLPPGDVAAWAAVIRRLSTSGHAFRKRTPRKVRTMQEAGAEMAELYASLTKH